MIRSLGIAWTRDVCFKNPSQLITVAFRFDETDDRCQRRLIDEFLEGDISQVKLPLDRHHDAGLAVLNESPIRSDSKLASKNHVERLWPCTADFVA